MPDEKYLFTGSILYMERIYLDYAASTPVDPKVVKAMEPYLAEAYGNPNSLHSFGREAMAGVDTARTILARSIGASSEEIIFTGSATEANNMALRGTVRAAREIFLRSGRPALQKNKHQSDKISINPRQKIIVSAVEHESVLDTAMDLEQEGVEVVALSVDAHGVVDVRQLEKELDQNTALVSIMYGNNEIGTIQPIAEIAKIIRNFKNSKLQASNNKKNPKTNSPNKNKSAVLNFGYSDLFGICDLEFGAYAKAVYPLLHVDAVQAFQYLDCDVNALGVDLMTLSAHKLYGPKGIGALYIKSNLKSQDSKLHQPLISPLVTGGGQEFGMRSGTQNVPAIVGFGKAVELVQEEKKKEEKRIKLLGEYYWHKLKEIFPRAERNGSIEKGTSLPHVLNVYFPGMRAEDMLIRLDMAGIAVSSGAACAARNAKPSHVLRAIGCNPERVEGSLRFSFGCKTSEQEIGWALEIIKRLFG